MYKFIEHLYETEITNNQKTACVYLWKLICYVFLSKEKKTPQDRNLKQYLKFQPKFSHEVAPNGIFVITYLVKLGRKLPIYKLSSKFHCEI